MKNLRLTGFLAAMALFTLASCKKEVDIEEQLLGKWQVTSVKVAGKEVIDDFMDDCERDNIIIFEAGGKGSNELGVIKCSPSQVKQVFTWTWIDKAAKKFQIDDGDKSLVTITEINSTTMIADVTDAIVASITFSKR